MQDRIQPSLLDRLMDDRPQQSVDGDDARGFSTAKLRAVILRDIGWLLNTAWLEATDDLELYPEAQASTINYGIPPLSGEVMEGIDLDQLCRSITMALRRFEPRLVAETIRVKALNGDSSLPLAAPNFQIEAELYAHPVPLRMLMRAEPDPDRAGVRVVEMRGEAG